MHYGRYKTGQGGRRSHRRRRACFHSIHDQYGHERRARHPGPDQATGGGGVRSGARFGIRPGVRRGGSAALDLSYVACGRLEGYYETRLKPWDSAAGWLVITEAGSRVTGMYGREYSPFLPHLLATNGVLHEDLLGLMEL